MAGRQQRALDLDGLTEKYRTVNSLQEKERRQYLARKPVPNKPAGNKRFIMWPKRELFIAEQRGNLKRGR